MKKWDVFLSHTSHDKIDVVRPLYWCLRRRNIDAWYDESSLKIGDSLREKIDEGLSKSNVGIIILSEAFFNKKQWPKAELDALWSGSLAESKRIIPVWHGLTSEKIGQHSPLLQPILALDTKNGIFALARKIEEVLRQDEGFREKIKNSIKIDPNYFEEREVLEARYHEVCEKNTVLEEFCTDIALVVDYKVTSVEMLNAGEVSDELFNRFALRLVHLLDYPRALRLLQLVWSVQEKINIRDELVRELLSLPISDEQIVSTAHTFPRSMDLRMFKYLFNALHRHKVGPIDFGSALDSLEFRQYADKYEQHRCLELVRWWQSENFDGAKVIDAVYALGKFMDSGKFSESYNWIMELFCKWDRMGLMKQCYTMKIGNHDQTVAEVLGRRKI